MSKKKLDHKAWLICESLLNDETWLFHREKPQFLGQIFDEDEAPISGLTLSLSNGQIMANIIWYDEPIVATKKLAAIVDEAGQALNLYDGILKIDRRELLRKEINDCGQSIPAVARQAGVNQQTIYNYLKGRSDMTVTMYDRIIKAIDSLY